VSFDPRSDLRVLKQVTEFLSKERVLEDALQEVTDACLKLLPGDHASIRLVDASGSRLLAAARSGAGVEHLSLSLTRGQGIAGWVLDHGESALVADVRSDPRFLAAVGQGFAIRSIVAEPLLSGSSAIGVLSVSSAAPGAFSKDDEMLARILANCCVPALDRARLERLAVIDELTTALGANALQGHLKAEMERSAHSGTPLSILVIDLDHVDRINMAFGRDLGDKVLVEFAPR
jgi:GAF domain-containing protein